MTNPPHPIRKLLVANRGEIAIRVFRAASEMDIRTVAIYTYEDRFSLHRYKADEAYELGPRDEALKPYLDIPEIIRVAGEAGADAIHPGYGFLSENPDFATACMEAGLVWVGPSPDAMRSLANKVEAKRMAERAGVPIIRSESGPFGSDEELAQRAAAVGYPLVVKATAGGGGRGMRVVRDASQLVSRYREASKEALTAFGDGTVFLEKYIEAPKHMEVQVLGDHAGNLLHLFERDCSVQRRFQKIVEIAPSPTLTEDAREELYGYAVAIGKEVGYTNAGTIEFLVDANEDIYFIEVNTRIQVEHTITEVITGIDIVKSQILIAMGYSLGHPEIGLPSQDDVSMRGYSIQCRITTEDPLDDFRPDYGRLVAYRSASGFGIRLDAGSAYQGARISPFFDSMLVKVTSWGHHLEAAADRLHRALREFRIRGVQTNVSFLLNLLKDETFRAGKVDVTYIGKHPELLEPPRWRDRATKLLRYIGDINVNGHPEIVAGEMPERFIEPVIPAWPKDERPPDGSKQILDREGPDALAAWLKSQKKIQYTDTTMRDAHQSLFATRVRTRDMADIAPSWAWHHGADVFSMEVWGGATFDVAMRFLKESPWERLDKLRKAMPNTCLQMLLRGSNAVGYKAYPDNLVERFIEEAARTGIDIFRIFDSLNWVEAMKVSIRTVRERTNAIAEACICYTGDVTQKRDNRFDLQYYLDLARQLEDEGSHILCIKDMAGLLKPDGAELLIGALKEAVEMPIHLHTHDTSSIQSTTYLKAVEVGVDAVDVALSSMSGLTSQPNFNSVVAMLKSHPREHPIDLASLDRFSHYWEGVRSYYLPFESELRSGTAEVYEHEIPGGQYSNLKPQAHALGLAHKFELIKRNYRDVNDMLGGIIKVTPSSKVVGDMAMFLTSNDLSVADVLEKPEEVAFPESMKSLMRGELGQWAFGWPEGLQEAVLKGEEPYTDRPNAYLDPIDFEKEQRQFDLDFPENRGITDFLAYKLYPKVFREYYDHIQDYGDVEILQSSIFFYGMEPNEEAEVALDRGKHIFIEFLSANEPNEKGERLVFFRLNGAIRSVLVLDHSIESDIEPNEKVQSDSDVGAPLQGKISKILVAEGETVAPNQALFIIEAMKMESTITASRAGTVDRLFLPEGAMVMQNDRVLSVKSEG